jgi:hypothetical protein
MKVIPVSYSDPRYQDAAGSAHFGHVAKSCSCRPHENCTRFSYIDSIPGNLKDSKFDWLSLVTRSNPRSQFVSRLRRVLSKNQVTGFFILAGKLFFRQ